jgi:hypothetical protein
MNGPKRDYCSHCVKIQNQTQKKRNCRECSYCPPKLMKENYTVYRLYTETITQRRYSFGGMAGMDYTAILDYARTMHICVNPVMMDNMRLLETWELEKAAKR